jgi:NAD(P)-dependent dehydrogenase (short-subunit alcohol dehydrogenase family)
MKKIENKVAIITGAASGIGKATAILFAAEGYKVIATDINQQKLDELQQEVIKSGGTITTVIANIAISDDIDKMFTKAIENYGTVDVLINNAGIMDDFSPAGDVDEVMLQKVINVNLIGPFLAIKKAVNIMATKGTGSIINIASIAGICGARAGAAYSTSKHGLIGLSKNTAFMYAKKGIRCNVIAPGGVETNIGESEFMKKSNNSALEMIQPGIVLNPRMGQPIEIANATLFLASEEASYVNGAVITIDGGWTCY